MSIIDRIFPRNPSPCCHSWCENSTLRTVEISAVGKPMYLVVCKECGISTELCMTAEEAHLRAERGWIE